MFNSPMSGMIAYSIVALAMIVALAFSVIIGFKIKDNIARLVAPSAEDPFVVPNS